MTRNDKMPKNPTILVLNRNQRNLGILNQILGAEGYEVVGSSDLEALDCEIQARKQSISLVLMDITGFNHSVWDSCECLRRENIPFLVLSPQHHHAVEKQGLIYGAKGVIVKPLAVKELLHLIETLIQD
jgi:DNA-binding response OmpR family regulator